MKRYLLILALACCPLMLRAQSLEVGERWLMNERLIDLIESYERFSAFEGRSDSYSYLGLFRAPDAEVWCDYVASDKYGEYVTASEYVNYSKELEDRSVRISRLRKGEYQYSSGRWRTRIEFDKQVEYEDTLGFTFSTVSPLMGGDFHIVLDCVWMPDDEEFRIEKVSGTENSRASFPKGKFHIVQRKNEIDERLRYGDKPLEFNEYGFTILPDGGEFTFDDDDYVLSLNEAPGSGRYDVYSFSVMPKKKRIRAHTGYIINPLTVSTVYGDAARVNSGALDFGVDFGLSLSVARSVKLVTYVGAGLSNTFFNIGSSSIDGLQDLEYNYIGRAYKLNASESFAFNDATISVTEAVEYNLGKKLTLDFEGGLKTYLNLSASDRYQLDLAAPADAQVPDGYLSPNQIPFGPAKGEPNFWVLAVVAKAGAEYSFAPGWFAGARAGIEYGLGSDTGALRKVIYSNPVGKDEDPNARKWYDAESGIYPVVYRNNGGVIEDLKFHSFKNSITSIERGLGIVVELGVKYKF